MQELKTKNYVSTLINTNINEFISWTTYYECYHFTNDCDV